MTGQTNRRFSYLLTVAYNGTAFYGFVPQGSARTVASVIEASIAHMDPDASPLRPVSRTDARVHARGQIFAFDSMRDIRPRGWVLGLNRNLPDDVAIVRAARVPFRFEPRGKVVHKRYRYVLFPEELRDPFIEARAWQFMGPLDVELMRAEAATLVGTYDFRAFRGSKCVRTETVRTLTKVEVSDVGAVPEDPRCLSVTVEGDRFLYRMVRVIVGTLVDVGRGRRPPGICLQALANGDRTILGVTAPAEGLYLEELQLESHGTEEWPKRS